MGIRDLIKNRDAKSTAINVSETKLVEKTNSIPQREETEFVSLGIDKYISEKLQAVIKFDPKLNVNQACDIEGIDKSQYATNINPSKGLVHVIELRTNKVIADIPFLQLYGELLGSDPELDYKAFDDKQQKDYEAKYVAPTVEIIKEATTPLKITSLFGKKPQSQVQEDKPKEEEKTYQASIEDLPSNMQPQAQEQADEGEVDPMPTQIIKRGRKPKSLISGIPQTEVSQPIESSKTNSILQDIASSSNSVIAQLKTLGESIPAEKLPVATNKQNDGIVDVGEISFEKFRPSTQFIEAISTVVTEFARYFNQAKQKE